MQCSDRYGGARPFTRLWLWLAFRVRVRVRYGVTRVRNGDFLGYKYPGGGVNVQYIRWFQRRHYQQRDSRRRRGDLSTAQRSRPRCMTRDKCAVGD